MKHIKYTIQSFQKEGNITFDMPTFGSVSINILPFNFEH